MVHRYGIPRGQSTAISGEVDLTGGLVTGVQSSFLDTDIENILFSYGMKPDVPLTIFGLTTSIPPKKDDAPALDQVLSSSPGSQAGFEGMFDGLQGMFEGLGQFTRFSYYPNITVYPIAVYQRLGSLLPEGEGEEIPSIDRADA